MFSNFLCYQVVNVSSTLLTNTCYYPVGPIFNGQEVFLALEAGTDRSPRNVGNAT
jgi:hypothetical protein